MGRPSKTRVRTILNVAEQEFIKNHVRENIDVIYEAIPDVDKNTIKTLVNSIIKNTGLIKDINNKQKKPGPVSKLMGKNERYGAVVNTQAASMLADERKNKNTKPPKEVAKMKENELFIMDPER